MRCDRAILILQDEEKNEMERIVREEIEYQKHKEEEGLKREQERFEENQKRHKK
jgi:hypothetical protein